MEFFEERYAEKGRLELLRKKGQLDATGREQLAAIQRALDEAVSSGDPLVEKWEREIAEGKVPDLDEEWSGD